MNSQLKKYSHNINLKDAFAAQLGNILSWLAVGFNLISISSIVDEPFP